MHGVGRFLRQALFYAKPWQRLALGAVAIALGVTLVALGQVKGVVLVAFGALVVFEGVRHRRPSRRGGTEQADAPGGG